MSYAKTSLRADKQALREKMQAMGLDHRQIADEFARRYQVRPRAALREAYGWSVKEAAERINAFRGDAGLDPRGSAAMTGAHLSEHESWPGHGAEPSGRKPTPYLLALLAAVYGCAVSDLVDLADREHLPPADLLILDTYRRDHLRPVGVHAAERACDPQVSGSAPLLPGAEDGYAVLELRGTVAHLVPRPTALLVPSWPGVAYRWMQEPDLGGSWTEREVLMTAHEGSGHAERAEVREVGDATLEQLRADVMRLSAESMTAEPFPVFREMRSVRSRMYAALDRQLWPRDQTELYFLLAVLNCLMAVVANDLGYPQSAEELIRSGWAYATVIDHRPLMAHLRLELAGIAYWDRPRQSRDLAQSGLRYLSDGPNAAYLHLEYGRAAARLGDAEAARRSRPGCTPSTRPTGQTGWRRRGCPA